MVLNCVKSQIDRAAKVSISCQFGIEQPGLSAQGFLRPYYHYEPRNQ